jgi:hypothetical protein
VGTTTEWELLPARCVHEPRPAKLQSARVSDLLRVYYALLKGSYSLVFGGFIDNRFGN